MRRLAEACERIAGTTKKLEKTAIVAEYLKSVSVDEASVAAVFLSGRPFAVWEEATLQVGGALLWRVVEEISGKSSSELTATYRRVGDLGAVAGEVLPALGDVRDLPLSEVQDRFRQIALARGPAAKSELVRELIGQVTPLEAKYILKIITGDLRIGLKESLVEEAIANAFAAKFAGVQRANMLLGDIGQTLHLATEGRLGEARMKLFHPLGFMLASPAENAEEALSYFEHGFVEDKYDGIRAQAHISGDSVRVFSRTRDDITESFPELQDSLAGLPQDVVLDGEIVAWTFSDTGEADPGRAQPFSALQQRLGRKKVSDKLMHDVSVAYMVFDVLYAGGELLIDRSLRERGKLLDELLAAEKALNHEGHPVPRRATDVGQRQGRLGFEPEGVEHSRVMRAPVFQASSPEDLDRLFEAAQARGNEGLMIKDPESPYMPGRRGKSWVKLKHELATLDVVVTAVEYGHGKRIGVLSDYTFAVRDGEKLMNIGKAYSGLTDSEIAEMTKWFLAHIVDDQGFRLIVEPKIVLEVAFNNMMRSDRHDSGYALRFPRIVRLRPDKLPEEADSIERVREIFEMQQ